MPIAATYPGVYIEELPSGVRPITGVATSITAFVGYTARGLDNRATRLLSFGDYERAFGGLAADSLRRLRRLALLPNGGGEACVVRVPKPDGGGGRRSPARRHVGAAAVALELTALSRGGWANDVLVDVDHDVPAGDAKAFNLTVTDLGDRHDRALRERDARRDRGPTTSRRSSTTPASGSKIVRVDGHARAGAAGGQTGTIGGAGRPRRARQRPELPAARHARRAGRRSRSTSP